MPGILRREHRGMPLRRKKPQELPKRPLTSLLGGDVVRRFLDTPRPEERIESELREIRRALTEQPKPLTTTKQPVPDSADEGVHPWDTGVPGRRTIWHLALQEFEQRAAAGIVKGTKQAEAAALDKWVTQYRRKHPGAPPLKLSTIKNNLAEPYRLHKKRARADHTK